MNVNAIIKVDRIDLSEDIGFNSFVGFNVNQINVERTRLLANGLGVSGLYNPANALSTNNERFESIRRLIGVFADIGFSYKDYLFLNVTGRNDWSSTLPVDNRSFFYPGVSTSFIFTEAFNLDRSPLSYVKVRASIANVGSDEAPYQLDFLFTPQSNLFTQFVANNTYPIIRRISSPFPNCVVCVNCSRPTVYIHGTDSADHKKDERGKAK